MALLFFDGFDHYATADFYKKWNSGAGAAILSTSGRRGGGAAQLASGDTALKSVPQSATIIVGMAIQPSLNSTDFLRLYDGSANVHLNFQVLSSGAIQVQRIVTTIGTTAAGVITAGTYAYFEVKATIHDTAGSVEIRVNGTTVLNLTNVDTQANANAWLNSVELYGNTLYVDDLYICDTTGSSMNDFLGDVRVDTLFPNADGTYSQFTPSTGTSHFALVDEATPNTTDYNESNNVGDRDSYALQDLPALTGTIYGVQTNLAVLKADAGVRNAKPIVKSGTAVLAGTTTALTTTQTILRTVYTTDPNTGVAWTESTVNAMEVGAEVA